MRLLKQIVHFRGILVALPIVFAAMTYFHEYENDLVVWPMACLLFLVSITIRIWAQQHLRYRFHGIKKRFTTAGPYALVRNPLYISNTIMCLALITASEELWLIPIQLLLCATVYSLVVRHEEGRLIEKYGQAYKEYIARVPRWIPRWPDGFEPRFTRQYLTASILTEARTNLFWVPFVIKELVEPWFEQRYQ